MAYTVMVVVIVPIYWREHGPSNFLWLSDIALLSMVPALWFENKLIPSMMLIGVVPLEGLWNIDFICAGHCLELAKYMFDPEMPLYLRGLSLFHIPMPIVIIYTVYKLGYDQRAVYFQILLVWILLPISYGLSPLKENINWVYGFGEMPQTRLPPLLYLFVLMIGMCLLVVIPMHFLMKLFRQENK